MLKETCAELSLARQVSSSTLSFGWMGTRLLSLAVWRCWVRLRSLFHLRCWSRHFHVKILETCGSSSSAQKPCGGQRPRRLHSTRQGFKCHSCEHEPLRPSGKTWSSMDSVWRSDLWFCVVMRAQLCWPWLCMKLCSLKALQRCWSDLAVLLERWNSEQARVWFSLSKQAVCIEVFLQSRRAKTPIRQERIGHRESMFEMRLHCPQIISPGRKCVYPHVLFMICFAAIYGWRGFPLLIYLSGLHTTFLSGNTTRLPWILPGPALSTSALHC